MLLKNGDVAKEFNQIPHYWFPWFIFHITDFLEDIKAITRDLSTNKAAGGEIPVNILRKFSFSFDELTVCVNH